MHHFLSSSYLVIASCSLTACTHDAPLFPQALGEISESGTEDLGSSVAPWEVWLGACASPRWLWLSSQGFCLNLSVAAVVIMFISIEWCSVLWAACCPLFANCCAVSQLMCYVFVAHVPRGLTLVRGVMLLLLALPVPPQPLPNENWPAQVALTLSRGLLSFRTPLAHHDPLLYCKTYLHWSWLLWKMTQIFCLFQYFCIVLVIYCVDCYCSKWTRFFSCLPF